MSLSSADPVLGGGLASDIVIPVMGLTKAGKSSFLNELLGRQVCAVGRKLPSCTETVSAHIVLETPPELKGLLKGRRVVLVDTPGFDQTYAEDGKVLSEISAWLAKSYRRGMRIAAILYLHDISNDDSETVVDKSVTIFSKLCGEDTMDQVAFVTTKWDRRRDLKEVMERAKELESSSWRDTLSHGASVFHAQPSTKKDLVSPEHRKPWDIIYQILLTADSRGTPGRILKIQDDIVKKELTLTETDVVEVLRRRKSGVDFKRLMQRVNEVYKLMFD